MIPEAAVEAAAIAICRADEEWSADDYYTRLARAALEAAAPHIAAQALKDSVDAFPLETIAAPETAVVWLRRRAEDIRPTP